MHGPRRKDEPQAEQKDKDGSFKTGFRGKCEQPYVREEELGSRLGKVLQDIHKRKVERRMKTCVKIKSRAGLPARLRNCKGQPVRRPETVLVPEGSTARAYL